jgi:hypothetical protein
MNRMLWPTELRRRICAPLRRFSILAWSPTVRQDHSKKCFMEYPGKITVHAMQILRNVENKSCICKNCIPLKYPLIVQYLSTNTPEK